MSSKLCGVPAWALELPRRSAAAQLPLEHLDLTSLSMACAESMRANACALRAFLLLDDLAGIRPSTFWGFGFACLVSWRGTSQDPVIDRGLEGLSDPRHQMMSQQAHCRSPSLSHMGPHQHVRA